MGMEKLCGLEWKVEMCPDPSHQELWKWKIYMDFKFNKMQILWHL